MQRGKGKALQEKPEHEHDVWFSKPMTKIRRRLMRGDRSMSPCNKCSVDGSLFGKPSFELIKEYYESSNNRKD